MTPAAIALELLRHRPMLRLKPRRIALDVMRRFGCCYRTARYAVTLARENGDAA